MKKYIILLPILILLSLSTLQAGSISVCKANSTNGNIIKAEVEILTSITILIKFFSSDASLHLVNSFDSTDNINIFRYIDAEKGIYMLYNNKSQIIKVKEISSKKTINTIKLINCINSSELN